MYVINIVYIFKSCYQSHKNDMTDITRSSQYLTFYFSYLIQHNPHSSGTQLVYFSFPVQVMELN